MTIESTEFGDTLFSQALTQYVQPEVSKRLAAGEMKVGDPIYAFLIVLDGKPPSVLLNGQIPGMFKVKATRAMEAGEEVSRDDFTDLQEYLPTDEIRAGQYVVALHSRDGWGITFDLNKIHPDARKHFDVGVEFFETAKSSLAEGRERAFAENAHSAAELFARAELLCSVITAERVAPAKSHGQIKSTYNAWGNLGNTDPRYARVLNLLGDERNNARYLRGNKSLVGSKAEEVLAVLDEMRTHVDSILRDGHPPGKQFRAYATKPIKSGELTTDGNISLTPPKDE